jgi:hypothetical protein
MLGGDEGVISEVFYGVRGIVGGIGRVVIGSGYGG